MTSTACGPWRAASAAGCQSSLSNSCGSPAADLRWTGTPCERSYTRGNYTYSACTLTDAAYGWYCPDGSDQAVQLDPHTGTTCFTSEALCESSLLNACGGASGPPCQNAKGAGAVSAAFGCYNVDPAYVWACPSATLPPYSAALPAAALSAASALSAVAALAVAAAAW